MKTIPILLVLAAVGACVSTEPEERSAEREEANHPFGVIPLKYALAADVANAVNQLRPTARAIADGRTNSVIVTASSEAEMLQITDCIAKLDIPVSGAK